MKSGVLGLNGWVDFCGELFFDDELCCSGCDGDYEGDGGCRVDWDEVVVC